MFQKHCTCFLAPRYPVTLVRDVAGGHDYVYENISSPARCEFGRPRSPLSIVWVFRRVPTRPQSVQTVSRHESRAASPALFDRRERSPLDWPMKSDPYDAHLSSSLLAT